MAFTESQHPRAPKGSENGGEFAKGAAAKTVTSGKASTYKPPVAKSGGGGGGGGAHGAHGAHKLSVPKGTLAYDSKTKRGPGYGVKGGDPHVRALQEALTRLGLKDSHGRPLKVDGQYGPLTESAVMAVQVRLGLFPDGNVTPALYERLLRMKSLHPRRHSHHSSRSRNTGDDMNEVTEVQETPLTYLRTFDLDGIEVVSRAKGGDGRTVEAYAAVFGVKKEIRDKHGHYVEEIDRTAFNRTINNGAAMRAQVLYNHGFDSRGRTGGLQQVPLGKALDVRVDGRGLLTRSRYNESEFAQTVLESIKNGDITAQSFEGSIYRSDPSRVPGRSARNELPLVRRLELGLHNFGPTPTPYYAEAEITAVRSAIELAQDFAALDEEQREELIRTLSTTPGWDPETAAILATPRRGPGAEDSPTGHSTRLKRIRLAAELRARSL